MPQVHLFNPGYEASVLLGEERYTPPENVRKMQEDLSLLPLWYAKEGDFVYADSSDLSFLNTLPSSIVPLVNLLTERDLLSEMKQGLLAAPWGISPQSLRFFRDLNQKYALNIVVPEWKKEFADLTGRQAAAFCLKRIKESFPDNITPDLPVFCSTIEEVAKYLKEHPETSVLKTPYSSSGRGLLWLKEGILSDKDTDWIRGAIRRQGALSIEKGLDKLQDFAMEFFIDETTVVYQGLSLFETGEKGSYTGNRLESQVKMLDMLSRLIPLSVYENVCLVVARVLQEVFGGIYKGYIGVDMMLYQEEEEIRIHPCVEINMRYTMGMVAIRLFQQLVSEDVSGIFTLVYEKDAYFNHCFMEEMYPLRIVDGKIRQGYLSLCPVTTETRYRAYILIK